MRASTYQAALVFVLNLAGGFPLRGEEPAMSCCQHADQLAPVRHVANPQAIEYPGELGRLPAIESIATELP